MAGLSAGGKGVINAKIKEIQVKERRERIKESNRRAAGEFFGE